MINNGGGIGGGNGGEDSGETKDGAGDEEVIIVDDLRNGEVVVDDIAEATETEEQHRRGKLKKVIPRKRAINFWSLLYFFNLKIIDNSHYFQFSL